MDVNAYARGTNAAGDSANILHGVTGSVFGEVIFHWKILKFLQEVEFEWTAGESRILSDTFQVRAAGVKNFHLELTWKEPWDEDAKEGGYGPLSLYLYCEEAASAQFSMYVQTPTLQAWARKKSGVRWFSPQGNFIWGWVDYTTKEKLLEANVLSDGALTVVCHVKCLMQSARKARVVLKSPLHGMEPEDSSPSTLGTLLQADKESCDVPIV